MKYRVRALDKGKLREFYKSGGRSFTKTEAKGVVRKLRIVNSTLSDLPMSSRKKLMYRNIKIIPVRRGK